MPQEGLQLTATAKVKITKLDNAGQVIEVEEHEVELSEKEAEQIWGLRQQE